MPTGLTRRGARYYLRRRVPLDLVQQFGGKAEITKALGTADPKTARLLLPMEMTALDRMFAALRAAKQPPGQADESSSGKVDFWQTMSDAEWRHHIEQMEYDSREVSRIEFEREERADLERKIAGLADGSAEGLSDEQLAVRDLLRDSAQYRKFAEERAQALSAAPSPPRFVSPSGAKDTYLDAIVDKWAAERKVGDKGVDTHRAVAGWFVKRVGNLPVSKIAKRDVLAFKDRLLEEGASAANVKVKLTRLRTLLNYAVANDYAAENAAKDVTVVVPEAERNKRKPFDVTSLTAIFTSPIYSQDERPTEGRGEAAYWLPLLALYTGARLEELGQLRPSDIREEVYVDADDGEAKAWFIHVVQDENEGLKLKNAGSERVIPVHPSLEQLGFIRFVRAAKNAGQARLFSELRPNKYGRLTAKWGEWFGDYKRNVIGITDPRLVFHSFRHTFKRYARHVKMVEGVQRQIMGHSGKDAADEYGDGYTLHQLVEGMRLYRLPGFKLPAPPPALRT